VNVKRAQCHMVRSTYQSFGNSKRTIFATTRAFCSARRESASLTALSRRRDRMASLSSLLTALSHGKCSPRKGGWSYLVAVFRQYLSMPFLSWMMAR
jgi:hypothetical protein